MNIGLRNFKILNALFSIKLSQQQCALNSFSATSVAVVTKHNDECNTINNGHGRGCGLLRSGVNNITTGGATKNSKNNTILWTKFTPIRGYSSISPKPAESEEDKKIKNSNNDQDDKQMPKPEESDKRTLPRLMNFPEIMWPSMLNSVKNFILVQFIIRPYMDNEFNLRDFGKGAKKAMQVVSAKLMNGEFGKLGSLVSSDAINELKPVIQKLSVSQRRQLEVKESDIYLTFPYQVGIMFDEENESAQKRWVEITMVFHVLRGLQEMREAGEEIPWNMGTMPEYQDRVFVCNYRFIKEFTKGQESDWTINKVNHFKPIDLINEVKRH